jgi:two-component system chemotaxis response regulator CheY
MAKIMIVDDSESLRIQLKKIIESKGHTVCEGHDGKHGLDVLKQNLDAKLIICDVNMPNMDGITMCTKVKEDASLANIPIFMLTTESSAELKEKGKKVGVKAWVTKPFDEAKLMDAVAKVLSM